MKAVIQRVSSSAVTVDGKEYSFKKVWIAPTQPMYGKMGGTLPTNNNSMNNE